jgi:hypothetical protein
MPLSCKNFFDKGINEHSLKKKGDYQESHANNHETQPQQHPAEEWMYYRPFGSDLNLPGRHNV